MEKPNRLLVIIN